MSTPGEEELHAAAERRRDRDAAEAAKSRPAKGAAARGSQRQKRYRVREALAESGGVGKVTSVVAVMFGLLAPMALVLVYLDGDSFLGLASAVAGMAVGCFGMMWVHERVFSAIRLHALRGIGRGLDVDAYLRALSENRRSAELVMRVSFERPWPTEAQTSAPDAVREWMPTLGRAEWARHVLVMHSAQLDGTKYESGGDTGGGRFFNNSAIHGCFMQLVRQVLPRLEAVAPISRLEVEVVGKIEAWDAEP